MSTIDKALPNVVETTVKTPSDEEVAIAEEKVFASFRICLKSSDLSIIIRSPFTNLELNFFE